jgi:hypothetical protein
MHQGLLHRWRGLLVVYLERFTLEAAIKFKNPTPAEQL